jgi:hypothetical protein
METRFITNYNDGASLEILGDDNNTYVVQFYDNKNGELIHQTELKCNHWTKTTRKYFTEWKIVVILNNTEVFSEIFDCHKKNVLIKSDSRALGDSICYAPYYSEFRKKHDCNVTVASMFHWLLKDYYPDIEWVEYDKSSNKYKESYATYKIVVGINMGLFNEEMSKLENINTRNPNTPIKYIKGLTFFDKGMHREHPMFIPLQKQITNMLGLEFKELRPRFDVEGERPIKEKYICIAEFAAGGKHTSMKTWNNQVGWKTLVSELQKRGYKVISISKEKSDLNVIKRNGDFPLTDRMLYLKHAEFFIGVSSGLAWLNWAMGKKTVMISGFTEAWNEFTEDNIRIINNDVCKGCYNSPEHADKLCCFYRTYCPTGKNFECTRKISPKMVMDKIIENHLI